MGKLFPKKIYFLSLWVLLLLPRMTVQAETGEPIKSGIFAGDIDLSGMTAGEAGAAVKAYVEGLRGVEITLLAAEGAEVKVTAGEFGLDWANPEIIAEAAEIGYRGNVVERYRAMKDLEHENKIFPIELCLDVQLINDILNDRCVMYDAQAVSPSLERVDGVFHVVEGKTGCILDVESSIDVINDYLIEDWDCQPCTIALDVMSQEPEGSAEELAQVQDLLGSFTTSYSTSNSSRSANIENGCGRINGITLYPGEEFSMYDTVAPFTEENGYYKAGTYVNGKVVDGLGGGICQVSTTLYNAALLAELKVTKRYNHSMTVSYVDPGADAAIAGSSGKDFKFVNSLDYPIYIEGYTAGKKITFNIYGRETRPENREVRYESEILEVIGPTSDDITADGSQPIGYFEVTASAHIGYRARLWKIVLIDGKEESRTEVNNSKYKMVPRSVTIGVGTPDHAAYEEMMAAIATGNADHVKNVMTALTAPAAGQ